MIGYGLYDLSRARVLVLGVILLPLALAFHSAPAYAGTVFTVTYSDDLGDDNPGDGVCDVGVSELVAYCSLRAAVDEAEATLGRDEIVIPEGFGTIELLVAGPAGRLFVTEDLTIRGLGATRAKIQGGPQFNDHIFHVENGAASSVEAVLENLDLTTQGGGGSGTAVYVKNAAVTLRNCWVHNNTAEGIYIDWRDLPYSYNQNFSVTISDSIITTSGKTGLLIDRGQYLPIEPKGLIERSVFSSNTLRGLDVRWPIGGRLLLLEIKSSIFTSNQDGGINTGGLTRATIRNSLIENNRTSSSWGGGGLLTFNETWLIDSVVTNNSAILPEGDGVGGGISATYGALAVLGSTISGNEADIGGGIGLGANSRDRSSQIINSTVSGNSSKADGGGISSETELNVQCSTIAFNRADSDGNDSGDGGGIFASTGEVRLHSSILAANATERTTGGQIPFPISPDCAFLESASFVSEGFNMISNKRDCTGFWIATDTGSVSDQHGLQPLANNGGPTPTHALAAPTLALDGGDPAGCTWDHDIDNGTDPIPVVGDQRGYTRPEDGGSGVARPDRGAFELNGQLPIDIFSDGFEQ